MVTSSPGCRAMPIGGVSPRCASNASDKRYAAYFNERWRPQSVRPKTKDDAGDRSTSIVEPHPTQ
jgi:hypothetical protein